MSDKNKSLERVWQSGDYVAVVLAKYNSKWKQFLFVINLINTCLHALLVKNRINLQLLF